LVGIDEIPKLILHWDEMVREWSGSKSYSPIGRGQLPSFAFIYALLSVGPKLIEIGAV